MRLAARLRLPIVLAVLALVASCATACNAQSSRVLIYGDSISWESQRQLAAHGIEVHAFGGTAICDWFPDMRQQLATGTVTKVYLEFVGNHYTPCVRNRPLMGAYREDAAAAVALWHSKHVKVEWVRAPEPKQSPIYMTDKVGGVLLALTTLPPAAPAEIAAAPTFDEVQAIAAKSGVDAVVDTSPLISPGRQFTSTLRCRPNEPCGVLAPSGYDAARAPDGIHLCPTTSKVVNGIVQLGCSVYSTSQQRFADEVAAG